MQINGVKVSLCLVAIAIIALPAIVLAAETITYSYDARGRLSKVEHSGNINNGVKAEYVHDKADNRSNVTVSGSPNPPPPNP